MDSCEILHTDSASFMSASQTKATHQGSKMSSGFLRLVRSNWSRVIIFGLAVTLTSACLYAGWQQYSLILIKGGIYHWLCRQDDVIVKDGITMCPAQEAAIGRLFNVCVGFELFGTVIAGIALDHLGPRLTAAIGEVVGITSLICLIMASPHFPFLLTTAMILAGVAINLVAFPSLILEDYFPNRAATTAAYVVACQCLAAGVAPVLWLLWQWNPHWTFRGIWIVFLFCLWVPVGLLYIISLPRNREANEPPLGVVQAENGILDSSELATVQPIEGTETRKERSGKMSVLNLWRRFLPLRKAILSSQFILLNIVNVVLMIQTAFYQVIVRRESGDAVADFLGWTMPAQSIAGILLGRLCDTIRTPAMMALCLLGYFVTYGIMSLGQGSKQFLTATIFTITMSYAYTVKYSYIQETFPVTLYGTLVGISGGLAGIAVLSTAEMSSVNNPRICNLVLQLASVVCMPLTIMMWHIHRSTTKVREFSITQKEQDSYDDYHLLVMNETAESELLTFYQN